MSNSRFISAALCVCCHCAAGLLLLLPQVGCANSAHATPPDQHPKLVAAIRLIHEMQAQLPRGDAAPQATYYISIAPDNPHPFLFLGHLEGEADHCTYEIRYANRTLAWADIATVVQILETPAHEVTSGMDVYRWRHGAWISDTEAFFEQMPARRGQPRPPARGPAQTQPIDPSAIWLSH